METCSEEEVMKQENFPHSRKPSHRGSVGSFGISEGHITGRKKTKQKPSEYIPNHNCRKKNFPAKGYNLTT